jgi:hypothetical protein
MTAESGPAGEHAPPGAAVDGPRAAIEAREACIVVGGAVALSGLTFTTRGARVLLVGGFGPLVTALSGLDPRSSLRSGELWLAGRRFGAHPEACAVAPAELPLPARMTSRD